MRWIPVASVLATGLLIGCASVASPPDDGDARAREVARMARNFDEGERDRVADELRAAEMRYASGDADGATWDVNHVLEATGDARAAEVLGKFALSEGRFVAAERHFADAIEMTDPEQITQIARIEDLQHLVGGFRAYESGALPDAERHWAAIRDEGVRASLARARADGEDDGSDVALGGAR